MDSRITSKTMLQILAAACIMTVAGYMAISSTSTTTTVSETVYAQSNALQAINTISQVAPQPVFEPAPAQGLVYVVQPGDTFYRIACLHNVPLGALQAVNPQVTDMNNLQAGQSLSIPTTSLGNPHHCHAVKRGEDVNAIASLYGLSVQDIISANPRKAERLENWTAEGEVIYVPRG